MLCWPRSSGAVPHISDVLADALAAVLMQQLTVLPSMLACNGRCVAL
jgi:hypothetical protein